MTPRRRLSPWIVVVLAGLINLPLVHSTWLDWRLDRSGVQTTARVTDTAASGDRFGVEFVFDTEIDPDQGEPSYTARVDRDAYERARDTGSIPVRVLPERPSANEVEGQVSSRGGWIFTGLADLVLVAILALFWATRRPRQLRLVALEDVRRCRPGAGLERLDDTTYVVTGEVTAIDERGIELDAGEQAVRIDLAGFDNAVGYQQPAQVRARLPESSP